MKEQLPVGLFGPDWFEVEPDELVDIGNAGKETIKYTRSDLVQTQIEEAVKDSQAKLDQVTELVEEWRALVQEDIGLLCGECVTNCADQLEQALKEGVK